MKRLNVRQLRAALPRLERVLAEAGEILVTRRGKVLARVVAAAPRPPLPSHTELRAPMPRLAVGSEVAVRAERDGR